MKIRKGDVVHILNTRMNGEIEYEGRARVVKRLGEDHALVRFDADGAECERFIDELAQDDPAAYARSLNALLEAAKGVLR